ncbi:MAG TPA: hypothetical protein VGE65_06000 [Sphingobium sp.]
MSDRDLNYLRRPWLLGRSFEVRSTLSAEDAKAALRKQKRGWFELKTGPRGWILGPFLCLQLSAMGQQGPVVLARITDDGFGSRTYGKVGPDLAVLSALAITPGLIAFAIYGFASKSENLAAALVAVGVFLLFILAIFWLRSRAPEDAEPLVRFIRRALETPAARTVHALPPHFDATPIPAAKRNVDGTDMGAPPSENDVAHAILAMEADGFLIIDFGSNNFMQTALAYDRFILEKSEGSDRAFYRAKGDFESNDVIAAMTAYLRGSDPSKQIVWEKTRPC